MERSCSILEIFKFSYSISLKVVTSWWVSAHEVGYIFECIFCCKSFGYEIPPTNRYKYRKIFDKNLHILKDWMSGSGRFQFTTLSQLMRNQLWWVCSFSVILRSKFETFKNSKHHLLLFNKIMKGFKLVSSPSDNKKR